MSKVYKYSVGQTSNNWLVLKTPNSQSNKYLCKCLLCGREIEKSATEIEKHTMCKNCSNSKLDHHRIGAPNKYAQGERLGNWEVVEIIKDSLIPARYKVKCLLCGRTFLRKNISSLPNGQGCRKCSWALRGNKSNRRKYKVGDVIGNWKIIDNFEVNCNPNGEQNTYTCECLKCGAILQRRPAVFHYGHRGCVEQSRDKISEIQLRSINPRPDKTPGLPRNVYKKLYKSVPNYFIKVIKNGVVYQSKMTKIKPTVKDVIKFKRNLDIKI